jgi:hypothetical protein
MIKSSLENEFRSDNNQFFIDQVQSVITVSYVQFNNNIMVLQTRLGTESPQYHYTDRAKCYTMEMIEFLQDHCFESMFGVGGRLPIPSPPDIKFTTRDQYCMGHTLTSLHMWCRKHNMFLPWRLSSELKLMAWRFCMSVEPREVVHYAGGAMVDIATNGDRNKTTSLRVGEIFAIMAEVMAAQRRRDEDDAANADAA